MNEIPKLFFKNKDSLKLALFLEYKVRKLFYAIISIIGVLGIIIGAGLMFKNRFSGMLIMIFSFIPLIQGFYYLIKENKRFNNLILKSQKGGKNK